MSLVAWLLAPVLLALTRLLPAEGVGLGLRLGAATACLLLPGALVARALGVRGLAGALVWSLTALFGATAVMFAVHGSLWLALVLLAAVAVAAVPFAARRPVGSSPWTAGVLVLGIVAGISLWWISHYDGDAFFHLARVQKLLALHSLSLRSVDEFRDGGLHPGYAFPLWHAAMALVARLAGVGAPATFLHAPTVLLPLSFVLVYEAGSTLFRSRWCGVAAALAEFALLGLAPGEGGTYSSLALPATATRVLLLPALLALVLAYMREPSAALLASVAGASTVMTLVHPSYSVLFGVGLVGFFLVRAVLDVRHDVARLGAALAAIAVPAGLVVLWLLPVVRETASHSPGQAELRRAFAGYGQELDVFDLHSYRLGPELFGRAGAIAVAALALAPLAVFAHRRLWGAFVLGTMLATFAIALLPFVFPHFADAISISQARRIIGFSPRPLVLVGGALVLAGFLRLALLPVALAAGIALQLVFPGDFGAPYRFVDGGPRALTWVAFAATAAAAVAAALAGRRIPEVEGLPLLAAVAVALFLAPVAVHGYSHWSRAPAARLGLPQKLVTAVRKHVPVGDVVFSDPLTAYELAAFVPVYVNAAPTSHVADTKANRPTARFQDARRFFRDGGPLSLARRYGAHWLLVDRTRVLAADFKLPRVYAGSRYVLYRLP
ncbi:MAG: hypothetical protein QOG06_271 [Gaiellaceae bacterium]|jgi:hypothetical protein|nr:hypothetical protein [Gaiellaceae bacterium]